MSATGWHRVRPARRGGRTALGVHGVLEGSWTFLAALLCAMSSVLLAPSPAPGSEDADASPPGPAPADADPAAAGGMGMEKLLKLPAGFQADHVLRAGATRSEWRLRFREARSGLVDAQAKLEAVRAEIEDVAGGSGSWQIAPPGAQLAAAENPMSYRLTQELRRSRQAVRRAERRLTELDVEANLAGVPEDWRQ